MKRRDLEPLDERDNTLVLTRVLYILFILGHWTLSCTEIGRVKCMFPIFDSRLVSLAFSFVQSRSRSWVESNHLLRLDLQSKGPRPSERKRIYSPLPTALQEPFSCLIFIRFFGTTSAKAVALTRILHHTISIRIFRGATWYLIFRWFPTFLPFNCPFSCPVLNNQPIPRKRQFSSLNWSPSPFYSTRFFHFLYYKKRLPELLDLLPMGERRL